MWDKDMWILGEELLRGVEPSSSMQGSEWSQTEVTWANVGRLKSLYPKKRKATLLGVLGSESDKILTKRQAFLVSRLAC